MIWNRRNLTIKRSARSPTMGTVTPSLAVVRVWELNSATDSSRNGVAGIRQNKPHAERAACRIDHGVHDLNLGRISPPYRGVQTQFRCHVHLDRAIAAGG